MTRKARNLLIVLAIMAAIGLSVVGYGAYVIYSFVTNFGFHREVPSELKDARVLVDAGLLTRSDFFKMETYGLLGTIREAAGIQDEKERQKLTEARVSRMINNFADLRVTDSEVIAIGEFGGFVLDLDGNLKREIFFEPLTETVKIGSFEQQTTRSNIGTVRIVKLDADHFGFVSFDRMQGVRVFDQNGDQIWSHGKEDIDLTGLFNHTQAEEDKRRNVLEVAVGDLDGDRVSEYIVASRNDGIRAFDRSGRELWFQPDDHPDARLEVADLDGDGKGEVIEVGRRIRDSTGKIVIELNGSSPDAFLLVPGKERTKIESLSIGAGELVYWNENGDPVFRGSTPLSNVRRASGAAADAEGTEEPSFLNESIAFPQAVWASFRKNEPRYLAVVGVFFGLPRSNLYVYDSKGQLVYHELLPEEAETITVIPSGEGTDQLLVGGKNTIWRYSVN